MKGKTLFITAKKSLDVNGYACWGVCCMDHRVILLTADPFALDADPKHIFYLPMNNNEAIGKQKSVVYDDTIDF
ncbi:MAG TPA: hypothetical protein VGM30_17165 [Puia sp.]|jgi:hypothetical protein